MSTLRSVSRLEARLPTDVYDRLRLAAELEGRSLTDFVVSAADRAALDTIERHHRVEISVADHRALLAALEAPAEPAPALRAAFETYRAIVGSSEP